MYRTIMTTSEPVSEDQPPALDSIWRQSGTIALFLTVLASCGIAIDVRNPIEALGNILFTVPITFIFCWLLCAFLIWVWRKLGGFLEAWTK